MASPQGDPIHVSDTAAEWTIVNAAEAMPGVATPLGWTWFHRVGELATWGTLADFGAISERAVFVRKDPDEHFSGVFFGRLAANVDLFRKMGDMIPGTSGAAVEAQYFGGTTASAKPTWNLARIPVIGVKLPLNAVRKARELTRLRDEVERWWSQAVAPGSTRDAAAARAVFREALRYWETVCRIHTFISFVAQGLYEQVRRMCEAAGDPGLVVQVVNADKAVYETSTITGLWDIAHGKATLEEFLSVHGFHGPAEGELSSYSWREDPAPLDGLLAAYRGKSADEVLPLRINGAARTQRIEAEAALLGRMGRLERIETKTLLRLARHFIPLREEGRATFIRAHDVARCMARRLGEDLVANGLLDDREDVFYLTIDELLGTLPEDPRATVAFRRARRDEYLGYRLPERWRGVPTPIPARPGEASTGLEREVSDVKGMGVSPGVVEGRALVVHDPADPVEILPGDILVCHTTDPSWAAMFFAVSGCVIDVGGAMSHGAIVCRELGLPCVMNTGNGTTRLRTGDQIRIDGRNGIVQFLAAIPESGTVGLQ